MTTRTAKDNGQQRDTGAKRPSLTLSNYVTNGVIVTLFLLIVLPASAATSCSITSGPNGYPGVVYNPYPAGVVPVYDSLPGIAYGQSITIVCNQSGALVHEAWTPDNDPPTYVGGTVICNYPCNGGTTTTVPWNSRYRYRIGMNGPGQPIFWYAIGGTGSLVPTIDVWVDPSTGPEPMYATVHFTVTGVPTISQSWEIRDPDGVVKSTGSGSVASTTFTFNRAGTWTVYAWATNSYGQAADTADVVVTSQELPPTVTPSPAYTLVPNVTYAPVAPGNVTTLATLATLATPSAPAVPGNITSGYVDTINDMRDMTNSFAESILGKLDIPFLMINGFFETVTQELAGIVTAFSGDAHAVLYLVTKTMNALPSGVKLLMSYALCGDLIVLLLRGET